jgi:hypothetical protein
MNVYDQDLFPFFGYGYRYVYEYRYGYIYKSSKNYFHFLFYDNMEIIYSYILV